MAFRSVRNTTEGVPYSFRRFVVGLRFARPHPTAFRIAYGGQHFVVSVWLHIHPSRASAYP